MTLLSLCIPTFNRAEQIEALVVGLLQVQGDFEVCVHDDGSDDDTYARLSALSDARLRISTGPNGGRAQALNSAVGMSRGRYVMIFDDDDFLYPEGLLSVLADCATPLPDGCAGYIYHLEDESGCRIGADFPVERSNLVALRADCGIMGDKKEVVLRSVLVPAMQVSGRPRRVPTSLYWTRISMSYDVVCRNITIGRKTYLAGGMSDRISVLKAANPWPMYLLARERLNAFAAGRYRSVGFLLRSLAAFGFHGVRALTRRFGRKVV